MCLSLQNNQASEAQFSDNTLSPVFCTSLGHWTPKTFITRKLCELIFGPPKSVGSDGIPQNKQNRHSPDTSTQRTQRWPSPLPSSLPARPSLPPQTTSSSSRMRSTKPRASHNHTRWTAFIWSHDPNWDDQDVAELWGSQCSDIRRQLQGQPPHSTEWWLRGIMWLLRMWGVLLLHNHLKSIKDYFWWLFYVSFSVWMLSVNVHDVV